METTRKQSRAGECGSARAKRGEHRREQPRAEWVHLRRRNVAGDHRLRRSLRTAVHVILTCAASLFPALAGAAESPGVVDQWLAAQQKLQTWSADLTQIRQLKTLTHPLVSTGRVWFAAPEKFRWEIGTPAQTVAVRSTNEMLVFYPRLKRVERYPLDGDRMGQWKDTLALLEAGFPRSRRDMEERFRILSVATSNAVNTVVLQPRLPSARRMMPQITISFGTNDFLLRATELQFGDGSTMRNEFRNMQVNPPLDAPLFAPKIEPDYKVIEPMKR